MSEPLKEPSAQGQTGDPTVEALVLKRYELDLAAPNEWRHRASAAASLQSAAGAALLAGLLLGPHESFPSHVRALSIAAAIAYFAAVFLFLLAGTRPPVNVAYNEVSGKLERAKRRARENKRNVPADRFIEVTFDEVSMQARPLRALVVGGSVAAGIAMTFTALAICFVVTDSGSSARVSMSEEYRRVVKQHCPKYSTDDWVLVGPSDPGTIAITVPEDLCLHGSVRTVLPATDVIVVTR